MFGAVINAVMAAVNAAMFVAVGSPWSLGAAVFCTLVCLICLAGARR